MVECQGNGGDFISGHQECCGSSGAVSECGFVQVLKWGPTKFEKEANCQGEIWVEGG